MSKREVLVLKEFLPYAALRVMRTERRAGLVPAEYEFFDRKDDSAPVETVHFQEGPFRQGTNGVTSEALVAVVLDRLQHFQQTEACCDENAEAIRKLEEALMWMRLRIERRVVRGTYRGG